MCVCACMRACVWKHAVLTFVLAIILQNGIGAIHYAAKWENRRMIEALIECGCNPELCMRVSHTVLAHVSRSREYICLYILAR